MTIDADCEAESLHARGSLVVNGLLNAGTIELKMNGPCSAAEIGGDHITVRLAGVRGILNKWFKSSHNSILTSDIIEGDEIDLENTHARIVRGTEAKCRPTLVQHKNHSADATT